MGERARRVGLIVQLALSVACALAAGAAAAPVSGPHETVDDQLTATRPSSPSGFSFTGRYHAAGDEKAYPPYMRKMVFYSPPGLRYDTRVPDRCTASDVELAVSGAAACPPGSRLGGGEASSVFMGSFPSTVEADFLNNANEQIIIARSPVLTSVVRGHIHPDGSVEFAAPTCFPSAGGAPCPVDDALQVASAIRVPAYTRPDGRSYLTTPPKCPSSRRWHTTIRWWWSDGTTDAVVADHPCKRSRSRRASGRRRIH
jgi:hypothetical protein